MSASETDSHLQENKDRRVTVKPGLKVHSIKNLRDNALNVLARPFKIPTKTGRQLPERKRRRVDYSGMDMTDISNKDGESFGDAANISRPQFPVYTPSADASTMLRSKFRSPLAKKPDNIPGRLPPSLGMRRKVPFVPRPLHDPTGEFAIVLYDPTIDNHLSDPNDDQLQSSDEQNTVTNENPPDQQSLTVEPPKPKVHRSLAEILGIVTEQPKGRPKVPVVIDPRLAKTLRPHQVEGVKFLYRCTTGMVDSKASGCIMADEMGLGKTLQCIALMWTLLRQSPEAGRSTIVKCVIACPASLVRNWANELVKWLGKDTLTPFAVDGKGGRGETTVAIKQWAVACGRAIVRPVLIISYETLRSYVTDLKHAEIGLLLCDEGHRLKNGESLTFTALNSLNVQRRVILSGTPIQNDLSEYFSLLNFANPGYLGTRADFRRNYEIAILRGRDADGTEKDRELSDTKLKELNTLVNKFIIRRTNDILSKYLPVKYEHVVFCNMSPFQEQLYKHFLTSPEIKKLLRGVGSQPLKAIGLLKKLCNHPSLLNLPDDLEGCESLLPEDFDQQSGSTSRAGRGGREVKTWYSGKMMVLDRMLARIRQNTDDKIVLISNYTQTLDLFEQLCRNRRYGSLRLDGSMNVNKRQRLVDRFNDPESSEFIFLLSSKAGGCGINLIGANRLILFDPDWNPAADQQALARVWRDGQKKDCFVYRLFATGSIEEKIFQRQSMKQSLSSCVVDEAQDVERHFSLDNLRQLFEFKPETLSDTHDTFKCKRCDGKSGKQLLKSPALLYGDTSTWNHYTNEYLSLVNDDLLKQEEKLDEVSYVFEYISH